MCARYSADYGVEYTPAEVIITAGGKQALYNAAMCLFGAGDEVITHMPGWPTLVEQIKLAEATPVIVRTQAEDGFRLRADAILAAITPRTRGIIINSPGNPTGALISEDDLARDRRRSRAARHLDPARSLLRAADLRPDAAQPARRPGRADARPHGAVRVGVEGVRDDRLALRLGARPGGARRRVQRAPEPLDVERLLDHAEGGRRGADRPAGLRHRDARRVPRPPRPAAATGSRPSRGFACGKPAGAFYLFLDVSDFLSPDGFRTSAELAQALLDDARVALTPGEAFDAPGFLRLSYATSLEELRARHRPHPRVRARARPSRPRAVAGA